MIKVSVKETEISIKGHAFADNRGQDIVCAAVSVLTQSLANSVEALTHDKFKCDLKNGDAHITFGNVSERTRTLIDSFFIGICGVANSYPDKVRFE